jgi:hypothetical protein
MTIFTRTESERINAKCNRKEWAAAIRRPGLLQDHRAKESL